MSKKIIAKITINDNRYLSIEAAEPSLNELSKEFTYNDFSNCFINGSFKKENAVKQCFLVRSSTVNTAALLPIGFLNQLTKYLKEKSAIYKVFEERTIEDFEFSDDEIKSNLKNFQLYDFQIDAVKKCLKNRSGVIKSPTGSGKTIILLSLCNLMKKKTLILFARIDLAHQTLERAKEAGLDAGIVQGNNLDENHQIVMMTVQSAHKLQNKYEMVIVDECHRCSSEQYQEVLVAKMFKYRFGFSATPWVKDEYKNAKVRAWIGSEIYQVHPSILIENKKIAKPIIHIFPIDRPGGLDEYKWMGAENHGIVKNSYRNKAIQKLCESITGQILILVKRIDHGKNLEKDIAGSFFLYGESDLNLRKEKLKEFDTGKDGVLIASTIFDEGVDIKNVSHVFIACGGSSFVKALQRIGRGTRITETKKEVDIYDFLDKTNPILTRHSRERIKIYEKYGFTDIIYHSDEEVKKITV